MTTTTQIDNIGHLLDLTDYGGDFLDDFDMDAVHSDYLDAINERVPEGVHVAANGMVFADVDVLGALVDAGGIDWSEVTEDVDAGGIDWSEITEDVDVAAIFQRHDVSTTTEHPR